ncbi:MAG: YwiC-like family protein [Chloroflexi bacterium]|jgi:hypothetical protein|nr:MAG: UbiA prenyltransferase [Chloroflexi bacterium OLB13]MBC6956901.1 prenyltransferase [Chloroflexota bacterium]MBV6437547.1 hypothetical protein [Anaerolineae bacterium]MDL1917613.1 prenyltransferase [Anaerolineae bacterium CFX4]OQY82404.1 MAG: hypothetical protein B6D42_09415 [Anaerolineae bacterium UTCFX5]
MSVKAVHKPGGRVVIRSVALPTEHGGWGFLIEPIVLGLLAAPTFAGFLLGIAAVGVFLVHQPLKVAIKDRRKGVRPPRAVWAERFAASYGLVGAVAFIAVLALTPSPDFLVPLALAVPLASVQLVYDARNQSRRLAPELSGACALAMTASAIAVLGGWDILPSLVLWLIASMRAIISILHVRARLKLERKKAQSPWLVWAVHGAALIVMIALIIVGRAPWLGAAAFTILLGRTVIGLSRYRTSRSPKVIGMMEMGYGFVTSILTGTGYSIGV